MSNTPVQYKHGTEAVQWLREYLNSGAILSALALDEQGQMHFSARRETEDVGQVREPLVDDDGRLFELRSYDREAQVSLLRAALLYINIDCETFGAISSAVFFEGDRTKLEISLDAGSFSIEFDTLRVCDRLVSTYELKT